MTYSRPYVVLDLETLHSAEACRHCDQPGQAHFADGACSPWLGDKPDDSITQFAPLGWGDKPALGLSIGCFYHSQADWCQFFDVFTLEDTVTWLVHAAPLLVSFHGIQFDFPLMRGLLRRRADACVAAYSPDPGGAMSPMFETPETQEEYYRLTVLCDTFKAQCAASYDILDQIWRQDPSHKFERGLNSLNAISQANGYGAKEMDGATAPRFWAQGRHAEVANYCMADVWKTRKLFEQICQTGSLLRGDGHALALPLPEGWEVLGG